MHCLWSFCIPYRKTPEQDKNNMSASQIAENPKVESKNAKKDQKQRHDVEDKKLKNLLEKYETAQDDSLKKSEPCPNKNSKPPISKPSGNIGDRIRPTTKPAEKPTDITSQSGIQNQITDEAEVTMDGNGWFHFQFKLKMAPQPSDQYSFGLRSRVH